MWFRTLVRIYKINFNYCRSWSVSARSRVACSRSRRPRPGPKWRRWPPRAFARAPTIIAVHATTSTSALSRVASTQRTPSEPTAVTACEARGSLSRAPLSTRTIFDIDKKCSGHRRGTIACGRVTSSVIKSYTNEKCQKTDWIKDCLTRRKEKQKRERERKFLCTLARVFLRGYQQQVLLENAS